MSLQHVTNVAATSHSDKPLLCFSVNWTIPTLLPKAWLPSFGVVFFPIVFTTSHRKSNQLEFGRLVVVTKFCYSDKDFHKNSPVHGKRFVTATCCSNLLPSVYWQLSDRSTSQTISSFFPQSLQLLGISVVNLKLQKYHISVLSFSHPFIKIKVSISV